MAIRTVAEDLVRFINASPSPFHAVDECVKRLEAAGFQRISETSQWKLEPTGKYFFTRNYSTICAFTIGQLFTPGNGFSIVGAHTDSPVLKVKPRSAVTNQGFLQVGVEPYGGGLWHTWFDRDLTVAGRVIYEKEDKLQHKLIRINNPILRIPNLAIHLDRAVKEGFKFNEQTHLLPVLATAIKNQLSEEDKKKEHPHHPALLKLLATELGIESQQITDFELSLVDTQPSTLGGLNGEFIFSPRLDNLASCFCSLTGLIETAGSLSSENRVRVVALFDNEEVGSETERGAGSALLQDFVRRVISSVSTTSHHDSFDISMRKSFLLSADMAHAIHPNYPEKHESQHKPEIHKGVVIKTNANQRYATSPVTAAIMRHLAAKNKIPIQDFVIRNDSVCGSTIGPILSRFGLRTVDIGAPQFSMHSIREMCGIDDISHYLNLMKVFFEQIGTIDDAFVVE